MNTKKCSSCKEEKPFEDFFKDARLKNGLGSQCKICKNAGRDKKRSSEKNKLSRKIKFKTGVCRHCKNNKLDFTSECLYHWVFRLLNTYPLTCEEKKELTPLLVEKLERFEYSCFYTGLKLIPGINASLDHRVPKSKGGTNAISNLEWVHIGINKIKSDLSEKEFISKKAALLVNLANMNCI